VLTLNLNSMDASELSLNSQSKVKSQLDLTMDLRVETLMLLVKLSHTWNLPDGPEHLEK